MTSADDIDLEIGGLTFEEDANDEVNNVPADTKVVDEVLPVLDSNANDEVNNVPADAKVVDEVLPGLDPNTIGDVEEATVGDQTENTDEDAECNFNVQLSNDSSAIHDTKSESVEQGQSSDEDEVKINIPPVITTVVDDDGEFDFTLKPKPADEGRPVMIPPTVEIVPPSPRKEVVKLEFEETENAEANETVENTQDDEPKAIGDDEPVNENEWDQVKTVNLDSDKDSVDSDTHVCEIIDSQESYTYLTTVDRVGSAYEQEIQTTVRRGKFKAIWHWITNPKLKNAYMADRNIIFCLAKHAYNSGDQKHFQMVSSVYMSLTGTRLSCKKFGSHWESIGFQGNDPGTDFRGTGMLGLLSLVYISCDCNSTGEDEEVQKQRTKLRDELYRISRDSEQNFPFALMSINWTRICLQVLREGLLNKLFNRVCAQNNKPLWVNFLELHSAVGNKFLTIWKQGHKTIADSGVVLNDLENEVRQRNDVLFNDWQAILRGDKGPEGKIEEAGKRNSAKGGRGDTRVGASASNSGLVEFSKLE